MAIEHHKNTIINNLKKSSTIFNFFNKTTAYPQLITNIREGIQQINSISSRANSLGHELKNTLSLLDLWLISVENKDEFNTTKTLFLEQDPDEFLSFEQCSAHIIGFFNKYLSAAQYTLPEKLNKAKKFISISDKISSIVNSLPQDEKDRMQWMPSLFKKTHDLFIRNGELEITASNIGLFSSTLDALIKTHNKLIRATERSMNSNDEFKNPNEFNTTVAAYDHNNSNNNNNAPRNHDEQDRNKLFSSSTLSPASNPSLNPFNND